MSGTEDATDQGAADRATLERLLSGRWSCRAFASSAVPDDTIEAILGLAQKTASWNNTQPWRVVVTSGGATERFRRLMVEKASRADPPRADLPFPREYLGVYSERRRACGFKLYDAVGVKRGDKAAYARQGLKNYELFDAPHVAIVTTDEALGVYGAIDCGGYVTNFMNAAQAFGVATIAQAALAIYSEAIRAHFAIPDDRRVVCGISFGFPQIDAQVNQYRTTRAALDEVVQWERD